MKLIEDATTETVTNVPLTREELAAFIMVSNSEVKTALAGFAKELAAELVTKLVPEIIKNVSGNSQSVQITTAINRMETNLSTKLGEINKDFVRTSRELCGTIKDSMVNLTTAKEENSKVANVANPHLVNSLSLAETNEWKNNAWKACAVIGQRCHKDKCSVLFDIYSIIRQSHPLDEDYEDYKATHRNKKQINMCANSDYYRPIFEEVTNRLHEQYFPEKYTMKSIIDGEEVINSTVIVKTPKVISDIVSAYASKHGISKNSASHRLYRQLCQKSGLRIAKARYEYARELGYKNISSAYYVANNAELLEMFKSIAGV